VRIFNRIFFLLLMSSIIALAGATIRDGSLEAGSDGNNVTIQWGTTEETSMIDFVVQRQASGQTEWISLDPVVAPKGSNSFYEFVDQTAFKTTASVYQYRIMIVAQDGTTYSKVMIVSHNVSSVKRTWGSLKAMFR
jgi:hypothetical protein